MISKTYTESIKRKSKKTTYKSLGIGVLIIILSTLPYIHDLIPKGIEYPGYSSLRVFLYLILTNIFGLIGWLLAYHLARGRSYRFTMIIPIMTQTYQIFIYMLNLKSTSFNEIDLKFYITFGLSLLVCIWYFKRKLQTKPIEENE
jgi:hypothetical protein